jgi:hypothetical protein
MSVMKMNKKKLVAVNKAPKKAVGKKRNDKKKAVGKRPMPPKSRPTPAMVKMLYELNRLSATMREEDLTMLVRQARILVHNRGVLDSVHKGKTAADAAAKGGKIKIGPTEVHIKEADDLSYFLIGFYEYQNFFSRDEMKKLVRMCQESGDAADASARLFNWFNNNRWDVLKNTGLNSPRDPILKVVYKAIVNKYSVKS